jgi:hypothetical protein
MWESPTSSSVGFVQGNELGRCYLESTPPMISPRSVVASTCDAFVARHDSLKLGVPGTRLVHNALTCCMCVA